MYMKILHPDSMSKIEAHNPTPCP